MNKILKSAIVNVSVTTFYIIAVATFMFFAGQAKIGRNNSILIPVTLLFLFVFSAAFTGYFIFGRPAILYLDGKKKEAIALLTYTFVIFFIVTLTALMLLVAFGR